MATPQAGDVLYLDTDASVQFVRPIMFRVIRVQPWSTYDGWLWLDGYQLNSAGDAAKRRELFVQVAGLKWPGRQLGARESAGPVRGPALSVGQVSP